MEVVVTGIALYLIYYNIHNVKPILYKIPEYSKWMFEYIKWMFVYIKWMFKLYLFWGTGFFLYYYIYNFLYMCCNWGNAYNEKLKDWDLTIRIENGHKICTHYNRITGQKYETEVLENEKYVNRNHNKTIKTWIHCQLMNYEGIWKANKTINGRKTRFIAHVDTGNQAHTLISKSVFDMLHPPHTVNKANFYGTKSSIYRGDQTIIGATGDSQTLPVYTIKYTLDEIVGNNGKTLMVSLDVIVSPVNLGCDILISTKDMQIFLKEFGYTIEPIANPNIY